MIRRCQKLLIILLAIVAAVTFANVIIMYWFPNIIPLSSFSAVRLTVLALIEKQYYLILVSLLIGALLLFTAISIYKQRIILPILSLLYLVYDFIVVMTLFIKGLSDNYWAKYIIPAIVSLSLIVLLCIYCLNCKRNKCSSNH